MKYHNFVTMLDCDRIVIFSCYDKDESKRKRAHMQT